MQEDALPRLDASQKAKRAKLAKLLQKNPQSLRNFQDALSSRLTSTPSSLYEQPAKQADRDRSVCAAPLLITLEGKLSEDGLEQSLKTFLLRQEPAIRPFLMLNAQATSYMSTLATWRLPLVDLSALSGQEQQIELRSLATQAQFQPFALLQGLPLHAWLLRLQSERHVLLLTLHSLLLEKWPFEALRHELFRLYQNAGEEEQATLSTGKAENRLTVPHWSLPLSFSQQSFWFLHQLEPVGGAHNLSWTRRLQGTLHIEKLQRSLEVVIERHESLRTTFPIVNGEPIQHIHAVRPLSFSTITLEGLSPERAGQEVHRLAEQQLQQSFDLAQGPLFRARLVRLHAEEHMLLLTIHHIIADGWSFTVFWGEVMALYTAFIQEQATTLAPLPYQYADYTIRQRQKMQGETLNYHLDYWRKRLAGAPLLQFPTDFPRSPKKSFRSSSITLAFPAELSRTLKALCIQEGITLFMLLLTGLELLLFKWTEQKDLSIGTLVADRGEQHADKLIGCLINFLCLRLALSEELTLQELLSLVKETVLEAYTHQECSFEKVLEALQGDRKTIYNPLYNVQLLMQNLSFSNSKDSETFFESSSIPMEVVTTLLDLRFIAQEIAERIHIIVHYNVELFEAETIRLLAEAFQSMLEHLTTNSSQKIGQFTLDARLREQTKKARAREQQTSITVAATFTAEPLQEALTFWEDELALPLKVTFAPYNQVFQQLLDKQSLLAHNQGVNVLLLRFEDWLNVGLQREAHPEIEKYQASLERNASDLVAALLSFTQHTSAPTFVCFCAPSPGLLADEQWRRQLRETEEQVICALQAVTGIYCITDQLIRTLYPIAQYYDEQTDTLGHIPFSRAYFVALGTTLVRHMVALSRKPFKVLVLDCDQTLWKGSCAEDGIWGIELDTSRLALQNFAVKQYDAGMLLCLCSKNNEQDVYEVFANRHMPLQWNHFVSQRINWLPKYHNLQSLANELNLGLESFIFLDDDPVECAEMRAYLPEVFTIQLPSIPNKLPHFLQHLWVFDRLNITEEDRQRTTLYQQEKHREAMRSQLPSLQAFLLELNLSVSILPVQEAQMQRAAQLTQRTNQFHSSGVQRNAYELQQLCQNGTHRCLAVSVHDRFGDYGLVGLIVYTIEQEALHVDTFLLSCRALGRGVEHKMLAELGSIARERGKPSLYVNYRPTAHNIPVQTFLESLGGTYRQPDNAMPYYCLSCEQALTMAHAAATTQYEQREANLQIQQPRARSVPRTLSADLLLHIATERTNVEQMLSLFDTRNVHTIYHNDTPLVAPRTPVEEALCHIWTQVLKAKEIGIHDDFFKIGGHSLLATQVIARINSSFHIQLSLFSLFDNPTIARLATLVETLSQEQSESRSPALVPLLRFGRIPLSFAQQRLWFLDQLEAGSAAYTNVFALRLEGKLQVDVLQRSLEEIVWRHESLRTSFPVDDGEPMQQISSQVSFPFSVVQLETLSQELCVQTVEDLIEQEQQQVFDLERDSLFRVRLLQLASDRYVLLLILHHIVSDGWSFGILRRELALLYTAFAQGQPSPLAPLPIQYSDYTVWQRQWLQGEHLDRHLAYWRTQLAGNATLRLPTDFPRPASQTFAGSSATLVLNEALTRALKDLSQQEHVTLFMVLLAAFQLLLARYSGQDDISIGTPVANRPHTELEGLIGFFVNTLVLRTQLAPDMSFRDLLVQVQRICLQAYAHQDVPFEKVVEALQVERDLSINPLFQCMFIMHNTPRADVAIPGLDMHLYKLDQESTVAKFDITLSVADTGNALFCTAEYNTDLFQAATIERMLAHWQTLLTQITARPGTRLGEFTLVTASELHRILAEWNHPDQSWPVAPTICEQFDRQVESRPDAIACQSEGQQVTYRALQQWSNRLADQLRVRGVRPESLVGVCLERSIELIAALLAVLRTAGAYVPLDPTYPQERLAFMLSDAQVSFILTRQHLQTLFPSGEVPIITLDHMHFSSTQIPAPAFPQVEQENLAYVIYTSGSTGVPKGILATHRATMNRLAWMWHTYPFEPHEVCCAKTSLNFVDAVWELFGPLLGGCRLVMFAEEIVQDTNQLIDCMEQEAVTRIVVVPTLLQLLLETPADIEHQLIHLRYCSSSGEALSKQQAKQFFARLPNCRLLNLYGSSEVAADVLYYEVKERDLQASSSLIPIGVPIHNTHVLLLDQQQQLVPIGVPGEIYIGGQGLAHGYLGRPELTAQRFVPNPWSLSAYTRLYRTGDIGRYREDGVIEYIGRRDLQVKLHGIRLELEEIEAVAGLHPAVSAAAAGIREESDGTKKLAAYLILHEGYELSLAELRAFCHQRLPGSLLPSGLCLLKTFPLLPNGKVDRQSLLKTNLGASHSTQASYVAPVSEVECSLAAIWQMVLQKERIGTTDNFFDLGGDSLLGIRMLAVARKAGIHLLPKQFFQHQTIAELSRSARRNTDIVAEQTRVGDRFPLLPLQKWTVERWPWVNPHRWNIAAFLQVSQRLNRVFLDQITRYLLRYHESLRTGFTQTEEGWQAFLADPDTIDAFQFIDVSHLDAQEQTATIEAEAERLQGSLNLFLGQMFRVAYFDLGSKQRGRLLFIGHHAIMDGYSMRIVLQDFQTAYQQLSHGEPMALPPKTTSVQTWARKLEKYVNSEEMRQEYAEYWLTLPWDKIIPLPTDFPGEKNRNLIGSRKEMAVSLNSAKTALLLQQITKDTTMFDILITGLLRVFAAWCGSGHYYLDAVDLGRQPMFDDIDLSNTVGCLLFARKLMLTIEEEDSFRVALASVKRQLRAMPNRGVGLNLLSYFSKDPLMVDTLFSRPLPEVTLNYMGQIDHVFFAPDKETLYHRPAPEYVGITRGHDETLDLSLCFTASIINNQLTLGCDYSSDLYLASTIQEVLEKYKSIMEDFIATSTS